MNKLMLSLALTGALASSSAVTADPAGAALAAGAVGVILGSAIAHPPPAPRVVEYAPVQRVETVPAPRVEYVPAQTYVYTVPRYRPVVVPDPWPGHGPGRGPGYGPPPPRFGPPHLRARPF